MRSAEYGMGIVASALVNSVRDAILLAESPPAVTVSHARARRYAARRGGPVDNLERIELAVSLEAAAVPEEVALRTFCSVSRCAACDTPRSER